MQNRSGITERSPTGTEDVIYSNGTKTESGMGYGLGGLLPANVREKEEFFRVKNTKEVRAIPSGGINNQEHLTPGSSQ